ncbi:DNA starvation/stationary phase protection protein Dps [uncultured Tateyamaria sp.]|uniref:DNA starvation/stationary phase protection protein Dps n=1 Tax=uncultured Tateyamaria sp. TaxID=455651 RepID=UPI00261A7215|nr:DNA starvation/stationary phase protection protein Dps [uncultured Tateyamaria sp.]
MPKRFVPPNDDVCEVLQQRLYDLIDLASHAKQVHWTVQGREFLALHQFFDNVNAELNEHADIVAERIAALGGQVKGTIQAAAKDSHLPDYPLDVSSAPKHIEAFSSSIFQLKMLVRASAKLVADLNDNGSADLLSELSRKIDEISWMVGAQMEPKTREAT